MQIQMMIIWREDEDVFPFDNSESSDFDGDNIGDNADTDDDNDGVEDLKIISDGGQNLQF